MNPSRRCNISTELGNAGVGELDSWFLRGNNDYSFYTSKILERDRGFLEEKYGLNEKASSLWINQQISVYIPHENNRKPNHLGFLYIPSEYEIELVFFPGKTNGLGGESLENRIQRQLREKIKKEVANQEKSNGLIFPPKQLTLPGF